MSDLLSRDEMQSLNRALNRRTGGRVKVGPKPISASLGIAIWNATSFFEHEMIRDAALTMREDGGPFGVDLALTHFGLHRFLIPTGVAIAVTSISGCATFGGNVKGSFACRAPDGICAPTSMIDDAALAMIGGDASAQPTGPYNAPLAPPGAIQAAAVEPVRSGEKVLRIVFPAHIDAAGRYRETTAIHAVVERGEWMAAGSVQALPVRMSAVSPISASPDQPALAEPPMRSLGELAAAAPEVRFPDPVADIDAQNAAEAATASPSPSTVPLKPLAALAAKPVSRRTEQAITGKAGTRVVATLVLAPQGTASAMSPVHYSLPPKTTVNPMDAIKAQVADRLRTATPVATRAAPASPPLTSSALAKPTNGPALFPVSDVNP